ncbi:hypothetical protein, variant [Plasmodium yoelii 17X]|nr:hypothetical protein, variant [Plasmodium yoelii 17X]
MQLKIASLMNQNKNEHSLKKNVNFNMPPQTENVDKKKFSTNNSAIAKILNNKLFQRNSCPNISTPNNNNNIDDKTNKEPILGKNPKSFTQSRISNINKMVDENYKKKLIAALQSRKNNYDDTTSIACDNTEKNYSIGTKNMSINKSNYSNYTHMYSDNEENNICIDKFQDNKYPSLVKNKTKNRYFKNKNTLTDDSTCTPDEENSNNELPQKKNTHFFFNFFNLKKKKNRNFKNEDIKKISSNEDKQKAPKDPNNFIPPTKNKRSLKYLFFH